MPFLGVDQPKNLIVTNGAQISWDGPTCIGSAFTYRVEVTRVNDSESEGNITMTSDTTAVVSNLQPNQQYTVSVTAIGNSCTSDPATKNFTGPTLLSTTSKHPQWCDVTDDLN